MRKTHSHRPAHIALRIPTLTFREQLLRAHSSGSHWEVGSCRVARNDHGRLCTRARHGSRETFSRWELGVFTFDTGAAAAAAWILGAAATAAAGQRRIFFALLGAKLSLSAIRGRATFAPRPTGSITQHGRRSKGRWVFSGRLAKSDATPRQSAEENGRVGGVVNFRRKLPQQAGALFA